MLATQWRSCSARPRSRPRAGRATMTMVTPSTSTNCAMHSRASAAHWRPLRAPVPWRAGGIGGREEAGPSVAGCDCGFDVVEESLKDQVVKRLDPLTPDRLILPDRPALDGVANNRPALDRLQLKPVLCLQPIRPDDPEGTRGTRTIELLPQHQPGVVQTTSL